MRRILIPLAFAFAMLVLAAGVEAAETPLFQVQGPVPAAKPPREVCPGEFDISRLASWEECSLDACNQWCVEEGARYSAYEVWISWGICGCKCCP